MVSEYFLNLPIRFFKGIYDFLYFWYVKSSKDFWHRELVFIKDVERDIGLLINLKLLTQPIFGDYSYMGRIIGPIFRLGRVIFGFFLVLISLFAIIVSYVIWLLLPPVAFLMFIKNFLYVFF
jgi:hypothetical protein